MNTQAINHHPYSEHTNINNVFNMNISINKNTTSNVKVNINTDFNINISMNMNMNIKVTMFIFININFYTNCINDNSNNKNNQIDQTLNNRWIIRTNEFRKKLRAIISSNFVTYSFKEEYKIH